MHGVGEKDLMRGNFDLAVSPRDEDGSADGPTWMLHLMKMKLEFLGMTAYALRGFVVEHVCLLVNRYWRSSHGVRVLLCIWGLEFVRFMFMVEIEYWGA